jgi:regulator of cell morphogenesis and NO signaling
MDKERTMEITGTTTVADLASRFPATIKVFQKHGIDFCCGGQRALGEACGNGGPDLAALESELRAAIAGSPPEKKPLAEMPLDELTRHVVLRYHAWVREELPRIGQMMEKVLRVHGERHPELEAVARTLSAVGDDIMPHMAKEEQVLFPFLNRLAAADAAGEGIAVPFGTVRNPIRMMEMEHEAVGALLAKLRALTGGFTPPADACNTFLGLYHAFAELERDTHEHIHVENNILHPRAIEMERRVMAGAVA